MVHKSIAGVEQRQRVFEKCRKEPEGRLIRTNSLSLVGEVGRGEGEIPS